MDKARAKQYIKVLIEKYQKIKEAGKINNFTEEETKKGFIEPLFTALGWDFSEKDEVSAEEDIVSSGRVDYGFYINGRPKFYLEAKPLKADLHREEFAKQAIRYSWNKGVTWAVLTDFESIKVFNAQAISNYLGHKLYFEIKYLDYLDRFDKLWELSKEAFIEDLIDKEAEKVGKKLQKIPITELLYKDLNECRVLLTRSLGAYNPEVKKDLLDEGVQKLLDRLIFIRVAEDRKIEQNILTALINQWRTLSGSKKPKLYESMAQKFRELDEIYNSNIFSPHPFEGWEDDGGALEKVIEKLHGKKGYYEYDFSIMPADILGSVYENYLGYKLLQSQKGLTLDKTASKRKEQGIYYTPSFVVDYIVENTLKPVLDKCTSVAELKRVKVLDPACGSGSFLIKALDLFVQKYEEFGYKGDENTKIQIITDNLYGVDLDDQAVEVARLNLLINCLDQRMRMPSLSKNIKNGNSLISGPDEELKKYFGENFKIKKPFNWKDEFPEVFKQGGFDVVIGNPPYVNLANIKTSGERDFLKEKFITAKNKSDLYSFFTEKAISLLCKEGRLGFIFPNTWFGTDSFSRFRKFLLTNTRILQLVKLSDDVFPHVNVVPVLIFLKKEKVLEDHIISLVENINNDFKKLEKGLSYERIKKMSTNTFSFNDEVVFSAPTIKLGEIAKFSLGIKTSEDKKFILDERKDDSCFKLLRGKDVMRYAYEYKNKWIWYKPKLMIQKTGAGPRRLEYFLKEKLIIRSITGGSIIATFDDEKFLTNDKVHVLYQAKKYCFKFLLGILNSKVIDVWIGSAFNSLLEIKINQLMQVPIPDLNLNNPQENIKYENMINLVDKMLKLQKQLRTISENSNEWNWIKEEVEKTDKKIDEEVYKLYGLTPEEIAVVKDKNEK